MKKIFTLAALAVVAMTAAAQDAHPAGSSFKLDKNRVIYLTCDTVTMDAGEALPWTSADLVNGFNAGGMALEGTAAIDYGYKVHIRNDYKDPETGFSMPKGYYRGVLDEGTWSLFGSFTNPVTMEACDYSFGFKNLKKVILYFGALPGSKWSTHGLNHNHSYYPGGRVQAQYVSDTDGSPISNQGYREAHVNTDLLYDTDGTWAEYQYTLRDFLGYEAEADEAFPCGVNPMHISIDQPFKLTVDLTNPKAASEYEDIFASDEKKTEFANLICNGLTEAEMSYYFADVTDCSSSVKDLDARPSATGWNNYDGRWGKRVEWSADTPIQVGIKKRLYLFGIALICGTDGATTEYLDASAMDGFTDTAINAYGNYEDEAGIRSITAASDRSNAPVYNLQGQRVSAATKGLLIQNGKKFINK